MAKGCYHCDKYGTLECHRRTFNGGYMHKLTKKQLLAVIEDMLWHHKGGRKEEFESQ